MTSCEHSYDYSYVVTNKAENTIKVHVITFRIDSVFVIQKDSSQLLFTKDHGIEGPKGPYSDDVSNDLEKFEITIKDSIQSKRDYLKNDAWTFNSENGKYSTIVTESEFE